MSDATADRERVLIERYGVAGLRAIATRALANGDDYARALLREQLEREELGETPRSCQSPSSQAVSS